MVGGVGIEKIKYVLWVIGITKKYSTRKNPFELVYGIELTFLIHLINIFVFKFIKQFSLVSNYQQDSQPT